VKVGENTFSNRRTFPWAECFSGPLQTAPRKFLCSLLSPPLKYWLAEGERVEREFFSFNLRKRERETENPFKSHAEKDSLKFSIVSLPANLNGSAQRADESILKGMKSKVISAALSQTGDLFALNRSETSWMFTLQKEKLASEYEGEKKIRNGRNEKREMLSTFIKRISREHISPNKITSSSCRSRIELWFEFLRKFFCEKIEKVVHWLITSALLFTIAWILIKREANWARCYRF
jgi:hypothetical protein